MAQSLKNVTVNTGTGNVSVAWNPKIRVLILSYWQPLEEK